MKIAPGSGHRWCVMRACLLSAVVLAVVGPSPHGVSPLTAQGAALADTVRVAAFDSIAGEPLSGAFVVGMPSGVTATTDSLGRFAERYVAVSSVGKTRGIYRTLPGVRLQYVGPTLVLGTFRDADGVQFVRAFAAPGSRQGS